MFNLLEKYASSMGQSYGLDILSSTILTSTNAHQGATEEELDEIAYSVESLNH